MFSGWFVPPTEEEALRPPRTPYPPTQPIKKQEPEPKRIVSKFCDHVDKDIVEAVLLEANYQELKWLEEVLSLVRIRNSRTGRYLKSDRYFDQIHKIRESGKAKERTHPDGTIPEGVLEDEEI